MFPKAISRAPITAVAMLGALGALILGGSDGAQSLPLRQLASPVASLPHVQQTQLPSPVGGVAAAPAAFARVAPATKSVATATKYVARIGSKGSAVITIQRVVGTTVDGVFGPKTVNAVRAWQARYRLPITGNVDAATWRSITAAAAKLPKVKTPAPTRKISAPAAKTSAQNVRGLTSWAGLNQAIARIPNYRAGVATWVATSRYGHWGATDLGNGNIYVSPSVPASRVYSVASHEYAHALTSHNYGWQWQAADVALNRWFGGGTPASRERAADCMALAQGATWTNSTSCQNEHWRQGARILLAGGRLP